MNVLVVRLFLLGVNFQTPALASSFINSCKKRGERGRNVAFQLQNVDFADMFYQIDANKYSNNCLYAVFSVVSYMQHKSG